MTRSAVHNPGVSLFPFLAVMICTMGVMMMLLVAINRPGASAADGADSATDDGAASDGAGGDGGCGSGAKKADDAQLARDTMQWKISQLAIAREKTVGDLSDEQQRLAVVEDSMRSLRDKWQQIEKASHELEQADGAKTHDRQAAETHLAQLKNELADSHAKLDRAIARARDAKPSFAIVPFDGPNGTPRQPIYLECLPDGVVLQPEGILLTEADFQGPQGPGNPLASTLRAAREYLTRGAPPTNPGQPYPLLLVRPNGIGAFYAARAAMASWASEFGYELLEPDRKLQFPAPNLQLAQVEQAALAEARGRYAWYAQTRTAHEERSAEQPEYRASTTGGGIVREGGATLSDDEGPPGSNGNGAAGGHGGPGGGGPGGGAYGSVAGGNGSGNGFGNGVGSGGPGGGYAGGAGSGGGNGGPGSGFGTGGGGGSGTPSVLAAGGSGSGSGNGLAMGGNGTGNGFGPAGSGNGFGAGGTGNGNGFGTGGNGTGGYGGGPGGTGSGGPGGGSGFGGGGPGGSGAGGGTPTVLGGGGNGTGNGLGLGGNGTGNGNGFGPGGNGTGNGLGMNGPGGGNGTGGGNGFAQGGTGSGVAGGGPGGGNGVGTGGPYGGVPGNGAAGQAGSAAGGPYGNGASGGVPGGGPGGTPGGTADGSSGNLAGAQGNSGMSGGAAGGQAGGGQAGSGQAGSGQAGAGQAGSGAAGGGPNGPAGGAAAAVSAGGAGGGDNSDGSSGGLGNLSLTLNQQPPPGHGDGGPALPAHIPGPGEYVDPVEPYTPPKAKPEDDDPNSRRSLADKRGRNWSLPATAKTSTPVTRPIHIECRGDRLTLLPDVGNPLPKVVYFGPRTAASVDKLVAAVWEYTKGWGIAGRQMYWHPVLVLQLGPSGEGRFGELQSLMRGSGLEVQLKQ